MAALGELLDEGAPAGSAAGRGGLPRVSAPRHTLCEFWRCGRDLRVCLANLDRSLDGGPVEISLPREMRPRAIRLHVLLEKAVRELPPDEPVRLQQLDRFAAVEFLNVFALA